MRILLISSQDYIHHPVPSRHHYIFERLAEQNEIHIAHFHISDSPERQTKLIVEDSTFIPNRNLILHYTLNAPYHLYKFNKIIKEHKIDVVVAAHVLAGAAAIIAAKLNKIPVLFDLKDWFPDSAAAYFKNKWLKRIVHDVVLHITKYNLTNSTKITTVSPNLVNKLKKMGYEAQLITNGVDTSIFKPMPSQILRHKLGISDTDFVIGFAGSIEHWYDIDSLISVFSIMSRENLKLLLVGGSLFTDYTDELIKKIKDSNLDDNVIFTGLIPYNSLPEYINCMDICTMPLSPEQWKDIALPNKFFEYTACGKPIITTHMPNVIEFNSPNVYVYNNCSELTDHIINIRKTKPEFNIDFTKHDWNYKASEMENVLRKMVE